VSGRICGDFCEGTWGLRASDLSRGVLYLHVCDDDRDSHEVPRCADDPPRNDISPGMTEETADRLMAWIQGCWVDDSVVGRQKNETRVTTVA
jgi:hypothetical protein